MAEVETNQTTSMPASAPAPGGKIFLIGFLSFLFGVMVGATGLGYYLHQIWLPSNFEQLVQSELSPDWGSIFQESEQEAEKIEEQLQPAPTDYVNPFEGIEGTEEGGASGEEFVNPFDLLE